MFRSRLGTAWKISALTLCAMIAAGFLHASEAQAQTATKLKCKNCVKSKHIKNGHVRGADIRNDAVTGGKIAGGAVTGDKIAAGAVTGGKIADGAVGSSELSSSITVGGGVTLEGATGNVTNSFSNSPASSNGLVKAWARMNGDGTVRSCWRCNTDPGLTTQLAPGVYTVDFTPLSADITGRPRSAAIDAHDLGSGVIREVGILTDLSDVSRVVVGITDNAGVFQSANFTLIIY